MDSSAHFRSASCSHNNCTNILLDPQRPNSVESDSGKGTSYQQKPVRIPVVTVR